MNNIKAVLRVVLEGIIGALVIGFGGFAVCWGLNRITDKIMEWLLMLGNLLWKNIWIVVLAIAILTVTAVIAAFVLDALGVWNEGRKVRKKERKATKIQKRYHISDDD